MGRAGSGRDLLKMGWDGPDRAPSSENLMGRAGYNHAKTETRAADHPLCGVTDGKQVRNYRSAAAAADMFVLKKTVHTIVGEIAI